MLETEVIPQDFFSDIIYEKIIDICFYTMDKTELIANVLEKVKLCGDSTELDEAVLDAIQCIIELRDCACNIRKHFDKEIDNTLNRINKIMEAK